MISLAVALAVAARSFVRVATGGGQGACAVMHRWELPDNYPVFTVVMVIYHYVERIWIILLTLILIYNIYDHE